MSNSSRSSAARQLWMLQARVTVWSGWYFAPCTKQSPRLSPVTEPGLFLLPLQTTDPPLSPNGGLDRPLDNRGGYGCHKGEKKIIFPLPPISGTGQKKFSGIASSDATAAARLCCWYFLEFAPKWVRLVCIMHRSEVQRLAGGWISAGLFYRPRKSAGKALLRIKAKTDLSGSGDGKSWAKLRAVSVLALAPLD